MQFSSIELALEEIRQGKMVILVDDEHRENEGDLVMSAEKITAETLGFMSKNGRGLIHLTLTEETVDHLHIPLMPERRKHKNQAPFVVSIEAAKGVASGASIHDRVHTMRVAIDPQSTYQDITMPGHVFPLQARPGGVLERAGHTEGSVDLPRLAGLSPAGVLCEIIRDDGHMARGADLEAFAKTHNLLLVSINDLITYRLQRENIVEVIASSHLPLEAGTFTIKVFQNPYDPAMEYVSLIHGELDPHQPTLVRIHSECLTGDAFGSMRCDCGWQLNSALSKVAEENGIIIYLRQEGRGIGLANKIKAYQLQSEGLDTVEANHQLGFLADHRCYAMAAQILKKMGLNQIRLLTNNPGKIQDIERYGVQVIERVPLEIRATDKNIHYLKTKRDKLGHWLTLDDEENSRN